MIDFQIEYLDPNKLVLLRFPTTEEGDSLYPIDELNDMYHNITKAYPNIQFAGLPDRIGIEQLDKEQLIDFVKYLNEIIEGDKIK